MRISASVETLLLAARERGDDASTTGRFVVTFADGATEAGVRALKAKRKIRVANSSDFEGHVFMPEQLGGADVLVLSEIGVAVVSGDAGRSYSAEGPIVSVDPEHFIFANEEPNGYLHGLLHMAEAVGQDRDSEGQGVTWGVAACRAPLSRWSGRGIAVAVLDSGFDGGHPEFKGRHIAASSFTGGSAMDLSGHGTHIAGTACGPKTTPELIQRYGIAHEAEIHIGKVLGNSGAGTQAQMLAGMNWAVARKCPVILVGAGGPATVQPSYTAAGAAALAQGCLMIAPAGGSSSRPVVIAQAGAPANSPTMLSVGALEAGLEVALFSPGGKIDLVAPGVSVFSAAPRPAMHNTVTGTSMAAAHVAGCAALWAQSNAELRGEALRDRLLASAKRLEYAANDVGAGLVQVV